MIVEYEVEPIPGLPGDLPPGERILWQGSPNWKRLAKSAFHVPAVAVYFAALSAWGILQAVRGISTWMGVGITAGLGLTAVVVLLVLAWLSARTTIYTLTNRRVVLRMGIALPKCVNLPLGMITAADLRAYPDGTGDIPLKIGGSQRLGWLQLWPHAKPWAITDVEPMLRAVPEAELLSGLLARTAGAAQGTPVTVAPQLAVAA